jgi:type I restriction enzyme, S subunit
MFEQAFKNIDDVLEDQLLSPVSVPKLDRQLEVVRHLEALQAETRRLESLYREKLDALDRLKKSLIYEAFSGNL